MEQQMLRSFVHDEYNDTIATKMSPSFSRSGSTASKNVTTLRKITDENLPQSDLLGCVSESCIEQTASLIARAFPIRTNKSSWCNSNNVDDEDEESGIILVKVPKGASSTSAGVAIRIASRHSCSNVQWQHRLATDIAPRYLPSASFLFTTVREPASRAVSTIFFHIISRHNDTSDQFLIRQLNTQSDHHFGAVSNGQGGFQLRYISLEAIPADSAWISNQPDLVLNPKAIVDNVQKTMLSYDFVIVPERMDESLVAMALLLNIDVGDVLVSSSKVAGTSQYRLLHPNKTTFTCISLPKSFVSPKVSDYLHSNKWRAMNYGDYLLYETARQSLDLTIYNVIGYEVFIAALQKYRALQKLEREYCSPHVQFPCSNDGQPQLKKAKLNCYLYYYDFGCGYPCIDNIINEYNEGQPK
jgi:hypothetical protein